MRALAAARDSAPRPEASPLRMRRLGARTPRFRISLPTGEAHSGTLAVADAPARASSRLGTRALLPSLRRWHRITPVLRGPVPRRTESDPSQGGPRSDAPAPP